MKRVLAIAAAVLVLTQALAAAAPMLHQPPAQKTERAAHGGHGCCPKAVVEIRNCCPNAVSCPHREHSDAACCCAGSGGTAVPSRRTIGNPGPSLITALAAIAGDTARHESAFTGPPGHPLDNSPPSLVLRN